MRIDSVAFGEAAAQALVADLEAELLATYRGVPGSGGLPPAHIFEPPAGVFLVGYEDGRAVACGGVARYDESTAELRRMYVIPEARGQGRSRQLLEALEAAARGLGYDALRLETGNLQTAAIGLYRSAGYQPIDRYGPFVNDERSVCFEKRLA
ncbi:MAG TPA: GNAT family N-acetyltransferase [Candidatus Dormibacteraeota bacterium]